MFTPRSYHVGGGLRVSKPRAVLSVQPRSRRPSEYFSQREIHEPRARGAGGNGRQWM